MIRFAVPLPRSYTARVITEQVNAERMCGADQVPVKRRKHSHRERMWIWNKDYGVCCHCEKPVSRKRFEVSHYPRPLAMGGKDIDSNRHPAHPECHAQWTAKVDQPAIAAAKRKQRKHETGRGRKLKGRPMDGTQESGIRRRFNGKVEKR